MKRNSKSIKIPIFSQIEEIAKNIPGWSSVDQLYTLFNLIYFNPDLKGDIIEIGSWCGRSTSIIGLAAQAVGKTKIICIDLFPEKNDWRQNDDETYSFEVTIDGKKYSSCTKQTIWKEPFDRDIAPLYKRYNSVFDIFMESIIKCDVLDTVRFIRGTSAILMNTLPEDFKCKLTFIDGDHSYEAVCQDIKNVEPFLIKGGWICFDDAFTTYEGVSRAIEDLIVDNPAYELSQQMTRKLFVARKK